MNKKEGCKYYDEEECPENCKSDWIRCDLCSADLEFVNFDEDEINCYILYSASASCSDDEKIDQMLTICPECYNKIKELP